jgi:hypothetical protein
MNTGIGKTAISALIFSVWIKKPTWLSFRSRALLTQIISICRPSAARLLISALTFEEAVTAAARDPLVPATPIEEIREEILDFLDWNTPEEGEFAPTIRIILASSDFSRDLTQSVIWLNEQGLDVRCIRLRPHKLADERVLLNVEQILPLPEADAYQTSITKLAQLEKLRISGQQQRRRRFLGELWQTGLKITRLHENQRPTMQYSSIFVRLRPGISLSYIIRKADSRVELHVQRGERTDPCFTIYNRIGPKSSRLMVVLYTGENAANANFCGFRKSSKAAF